MRARDTSCDAAAVQAMVYRRMSAAAKARQLDELASTAREMARAGIRHRHPGYTPEQVELAVRRLVLGDELFQRAWPGQPLLAP